MSRDERAEGIPALTHILSLQSPQPSEAPCTEPGVPARKQRRAKAKLGRGCRGGQHRNNQSLRSRRGVCSGSSIRSSACWVFVTPKRLIAVFLGEREEGETPF